MATGYRKRGAPVALQAVIDKLESRRASLYRNSEYHKSKDAAAAKAVLARLTAKTGTPQISSITEVIKDIEV